jgi:hypothetical protein
VPTIDGRTTSCTGALGRERDASSFRVSACSRAATTPFTGRTTRLLVIAAGRLTILALVLPLEGC